MPNIFTLEMLVTITISCFFGGLCSVLCIFIWGKGYIKKIVKLQLEEQHNIGYHSMDVIDPGALEQALTSGSVEDRSTEDRDEGTIDTHTDLNKELDTVRSTFESMNLPSIEKPNLSAPIPSNIDADPQQEDTIKTLGHASISNPDSPTDELSLEDVHAISDPLPYPNELPVEDTEDEATVLMHRKPPNS